MSRMTCLLCLLCTLALCGCHHAPVTEAIPPVVKSSQVPSSNKGPILFEDVAERAGIHFRYSSGALGKRYLIETIGAGCAFFDYDHDGYPDILLLQSGPLPGQSRQDGKPKNRLYHNNRDGTFTDVTAGSGLEDTGYSHGVAIGDYDGDGYDDIFIAGYGENHLFKNLGGSGRFKDVTKAAGLADLARSRWCTSAAFGDYNNDGKLDLYVCRYVQWEEKNNIICKNSRGELIHCSPERYPSETHALYRNNGDGTFMDVSVQAGITKFKGNGLAVAWLDYDGDGWEDIFVANDTSPYMLWHNNHDGTFTNVAPEMGVARSESGQLLSGMGVTVRDYNGDGLEEDRKSVV